MTQKNATPLALGKNTAYPAFQLSFRIRLENETADDCLHYCILTVLSWLEEKMEDFPDRLKLSDAEGRIRPEDFRRAKDEDFVSFHLSEGILLDVTALVKEGIWAFRLRESDKDTPSRRGVVGRMIVTDIALRINEDVEWVDAGVRTTVIDPEGAEELAYAYRPGFIRTMLRNKEAVLSQVEPIVYKGCRELTDVSALPALDALLGDREGFLPVTVFTRVAIRRKAEDLLASLDRQLSLSGKKSFSALVRDTDLGSRLVDVTEPIVPFDHRQFVDRTYGYGRSYTVDNALFPDFSVWVRNRYGQEVREGDIVFLPPGKLGGGCRIIRYADGMEKAGRDSLLQEHEQAVFSYSKRKPVPFDRVLFEDAAREIERQRVREEIRRKSEDEQLDLFEELSDLNDEMRGKLEARDKKIARMEEDIRRLRERLASGQQGLGLARPDVNEFFPDELHDLAVTVLMDAAQAKRCYAPGSRGDRLLQMLVEGNGMKGRGRELYEQIGNIMTGKQNLDESDWKALERLGIRVERGGRHIKIRFDQEGAQYITLPCTGSDQRGLKNAYAEFCRINSVYR